MRYVSTVDQNKRQKGGEGFIFPCSSAVFMTPQVQISGFGGWKWGGGSGIGLVGALLPV